MAIRLLIVDDHQLVRSGLRRLLEAEEDFEVEDDGRGFDPAEAGEGFGLEGMRERVGLLDGRLEIESRLGAGTTIVAEVPLS